MMKILISIALLLFFTPSVMAGETFVRNQWTNRKNRTETELEVDTVTRSTRTEHYNSYSQKINIGRDNTVNTNSNSNSTSTRQINLNFDSNDGFSGTSLTNFDNGMTLHRSGSFLEGTFTEEVVNKVRGNVYTITEESTSSHQTTAGVQ